MLPNDLTLFLEDTNFAFRPFSGPLESDPNSPIFAQLGRAHAAFGRMELILVMLALHMNKEEANAALYEKDMYERFSEIVKVVKKWIKHHYTHVSSEFDDKFFDSLVDLARYRNEITHGMITAYDPDKGTFEMCQIRRIGKGTWRTRAEATYDIKGLIFLAETSDSVCRHFVEMATHLFTRWDNPPSK